MIFISNSYFMHTSEANQKSTDVNDKLLEAEITNQNLNVPRLQANSIDDNFVKEVIDDVIQDPQIGNEE